jgi:hypothetical protein
MYLSTLYRYVCVYTSIENEGRSAEPEGFAISTETVIDEDDYDYKPKDDDDDSSLFQTQTLSPVCNE